MQPAPRWHSMPVEDVLAALRTSRSGLSSAEATERLRLHGRNVLPRGRRAGALELLARQIGNPLELLLLASGLLSLGFGRPVDAAVIVGVVVLNAVIGAAQELRAARAIEALDALVPSMTTVLRDGFAASIDTADLVPGDVVLLQAGDSVAADMRLLAVRHLQTTEAALTGESQPVPKRELPVAENAPLAERASMVFAGTLVVAGTGRAVVTSTGARTELGGIAAPLQQPTSLRTPLVAQLAELGAALTQVIGAGAYFVYRAAVVRGYPFFDAVRSAISIAVSAVPSGLPAIVTVTLAVAVRRMAARRAIVRTLPAVETLGRTTVICSDKTGTLTHGQMTVRALWTPSGSYEVTGVGYAPVGRVRRDGADVAAVPPDVVDLLVAGLVCNDAALRREADRWTGVGDPTEVALVVAAEKIALSSALTRAHWRRLDALPFDPDRRWMATLHESADGDARIVVKGAPEVVVPLCRSFGGRELDAHAALEAAAQLASRGMRLLAMAWRPAMRPLRSLSPEQLEPLALLGLVAMIDPPRAAAVDAVRRCRQAGIAVKMITGDHPATAKAIGIELGIADAASPVVTGAEIERFGPAHLQHVVENTPVFARVEPQHKLRLVQSLQARGEVVAMTGDGVNDAPALKQADVGIAMGIAGTSIAKQAADVVLADDDFASIAAAVEEGRRCYEAIVKAVLFVVPTGFGQALVVVLGVLFFPVVDGTPLLPILPLQILWVNLVTGVTLAVPLAFEPADADVMSRPPRPRDEPLLVAPLVVRGAAVAVLMAAVTVGLFLHRYRAGGGAVDDQTVRHAQTMATTALVLLQVFYVMQCRTLRRAPARARALAHPLAYAGAALTLALQVGFVAVPFMHPVFHTAPLGLRDWLVCAAAGASVVPLVAAHKALSAPTPRPAARRRRGAPHLASR